MVVAGVVAKHRVSCDLGVGRLNLFERGDGALGINGVFVADHPMNRLNVDLATNSGAVGRWASRFGSNASARSSHRGRGCAADGPRP